MFESRCIHYLFDIGIICPRWRDDQVSLICQTHCHGNDPARMYDNM